MKTNLRHLSKPSLLCSLLALWAFLMTSAVFAQQPSRSPEDRAKHQTEMMKTDLNLTSAQEPKVYAINLKYTEKMHDIRATADTAVRRKSLETLNKQIDSEFKGVLTADQF
ncbi:MAG: Spy/CpxP family protein refolding chaperone, partial [Bacteroidetes bacterium]|nr:Spy/CpxP family protein refolding chaperone [Bacteroidota bacterium]